MIYNFSKVYVSVEDLAVRRMHVDPDRPLFIFDERILIFLKSDIFYLPSVKTPKMAANLLKKTEFRRYMTEVSTILPALRLDAVLMVFYQIWSNNELVVKTGPIPGLLS